MKLLTIGILTLLTPQIAYGQDTKLVSKKSSGYKEEYNVLSSDKKVKHGDYRKYEGKNQLVIEGKFDNNKKVDEWKFYSNGELEQTYDFTTNELKFAKKPDHPFNIIANGTIYEVELDTPPLYIGSKVGLNDNLNKVMSYPYQALRMGIDGKVLASFWVDETNGISNIKIVQGIMDECDREVINGLTKVENNWVAGTKNGEKVKAEYFVIIEFKLHDSGDKTITVL